MNLRD